MMTTTIPPHVLEPSRGSERAWRAVLLIVALLAVLSMLGAFAAKSAFSWWQQSTYTAISSQVELTGASDVSIRAELSDVQVVVGSVAEPTIALVDQGSTQLPGPDATAKARIDVTGTAASPTVTVSQPASLGPIPWEDDRKEVLLVIPADGMGAITVSTDVGDIDLTGAGGDITVSTGTGDVSVLDVPAGSAIEATTGVGEIVLQISAADATSSVEARADVGDVRIEVPAGSQTWGVEAKAETGDVTVEPGIEGAPGQEPGIRATSSVGDIWISR